MKHLGEIRDITGFQATLAAGADVNQLWCRRPVIEYFFTECMRHICLNMDGACFLQFRMLVEAGADVFPLFHTVYSEYTLKNLIESACLGAEISAVTLGALGAKKAIANAPSYTDRLTELKKAAQDVLQKTEGTESAVCSAETA